MNVMKTLERKISKMKCINEDALRNLMLADELYANKDLSLPDAINIVKEQKYSEKFFNYNLQRIWKIALSIDEILKTFDEKRIKAIGEQKKAKFNTEKYLKQPLRDVAEKIEGFYGIFYLLKEIRDGKPIENHAFYKVFISIETNYKAILNLEKRIINKWYKFITAKSLIITLIVLTIISLIVFFAILTDFHKEQSITDTILVTVQERAQDIKVISNDKTLSLSDKVDEIFDLVTKTVGIVPQLLSLLTIAVSIVRLFFIKSYKLSHFTAELRKNSNQ
jgi:hypothetical protein